MLVIVMIVMTHMTHGVQPKVTLTTSLSIHSVIARYHESTEWTRRLSSCSTVFLYSKGDAIKGSISLPNVGREGHTYYHHIVTHYDNLPAYLICLQGNPFDHSPNLFTSIQTFVTNPVPFFQLSERILEDDMNDGSTWHSNLHSWYYNLPRIPTHLPKKIYHMLFENNMPSRVSYGTGAQFIVSRDRIRQHSKAFYQRIVDVLSSSNNPLEGYIMERFHGFVFSEQVAL